jgi:hypothetical protein
MFWPGFRRRFNVPGVDHGVAPKMDKGYADSAVLIRHPDFDCAKFKPSVRELAFAAIVTQPTVSRHGKVPTDGSLAPVALLPPVRARVARTRPTMTAEAVTDQ